MKIVLKIQKRKKYLETIVARNPRNKKKKKNVIIELF